MAFRCALTDGSKRPDVVKAVALLIQEGLVAAVFGDRHPNPHIRALPEHHSPVKQIELLQTGGDPCLYSLPKHLETVVDRQQYQGRPYTLAIALGEPQLVHRAFDLSVLEVYRNDPRYSYSADGIHGSISIRDEADVAAPHQVFLRFGFAFDEPLNKYVAVFFWDLHELSPEHQQLWKMREVEVETHLHPDYFRTAIIGDFPERVSVYQAFVEELQVINKMSAAMGRPPLFREDYDGKEPPRGFAPLLRPTLREFNDFVLTLDKMMSDNLNKSFFQGEVEDFERRSHDDGSVERIPKGTIRILEEWLGKRFRPKDDPNVMADLITGFRDVRRLRQKPAHKVSEDEFDQAYIHQQRDVMNKAYVSVRTLRLAFANHRDAKKVEVPEWLFKGQIWSR